VYLHSEPLCRAISAKWGELIGRFDKLRSNDLIVAENLLVAKSAQDLQDSESRRDYKVYHPVLLGHYTRSCFAITGLAVLLFDPNKRFKYPADRIDTVSRLLMNTGRIAISPANSRLRDFGIVRSSQFVPDLSTISAFAGHYYRLRRLDAARRSHGERPHVADEYRTYRT
jgi:hypothetical protein